METLRIRSYSVAFQYEQLTLPMRYGWNMDPLYRLFALAPTSPSTRSETGPHNTPKEDRSPTYEESSGDPLIAEVIDLVTRRRN